MQATPKKGPSVESVREKGPRAADQQWSDMLDKGDFEGAASLVADEIYKGHDCGKRKVD